jgi:lipopolysaccharide export system protein LptA
MRRASRLAAVILALSAVPALAQENPVKVTADTFTVNEAQSAATFSGNVVVVRADLTVWADEVNVQYVAGGTSAIKSLTAQGHVRLKTSDQDATGDSASFNPQTQVLRISGNVTVVNSTGTLKGPELVLNLAEGTTTFSSKSGGRVTGVFVTE